MGATNGRLVEPRKQKAFEEDAPDFYYHGWVRTTLRMFAEEYNIFDDPSNVYEHEDELEKIAKRLVDEEPRHGGAFNICEFLDEFFLDDNRNVDVANMTMVCAQLDRNVGISDPSSREWLWNAPTAVLYELCLAILDDLYSQET